MDPDPPRTGICVIRVEGRDSDLLITVRTNPDIERVSVERVHHTVDVESTILAIRQFIADFVANSHRPPHGPPHR